MHAQTGSTSSSKGDSLEDSPNIITSGLVKTMDKLGQIASTTERTISTSSSSITKSVTAAASQSGRFAARSVSNGATFTANTVASGFMFVVHIPGNVLSFFANTSVVSAMIRPSDNATVPVIDAPTQVLAATPPASPEPTIPIPQSQADTHGAWPMHGEITTKFGVPHRPYQPTHTGLDISSGRASGVTPIKPFKSGRVIEAVRSKVGLGNYVMVDHGGGLTSVYAHLYSIFVKVGQEVNTDTSLGYEGSTGVSTGTHLHFEIRVNGQPVNPLSYLKE